MQSVPGGATSRQPSTAPQPQKLTEDRLDSWKEIAAYLNRDVTTVQRWEKREGMPVHRHVHERLGSVYAFRAELDAWIRGRGLRGVQGEIPENGRASVSAEGPGSSEPEPLPHEPGSIHRAGRWKSALLAVAIGAALTTAASVWLERGEYFWRNLIVDARFEPIADSDGVEQAAAISRDGHFVAFESDRDGQMDVWVTQVGSGQLHNLTHGDAPVIANASIRAVGFSPDGALVTFWTRKPGSSQGRDISVWAVPTLGGEPKPYLEGVAEYDWSRDSSRLAYHTPASGDPLFVSDGSLRPGDPPIFTAPAGLHSHFPLWSPDQRFLYFVQGRLPDKLDVWRIRPSGGTAEQITSQDTRISYPIFLDRRRLVYLASDTNGEGPWLYEMDVEHRISHRLTEGVDRYTSLAAGVDGRRLVATLASPKSTLWRLRIADGLDDGLGERAGDRSGHGSVAVPLPLTTNSGYSPRLGPGWLVYLSREGNGEGIRKLADGVDTELWAAADARVVGAPAISADGRSIAFAVSRQGQTSLYVMQADGSNAHVVADALSLEGAPAWAPDGRSVTAAAIDHGTPHLFCIPVDGSSPTLLTKDYAVDPVWVADGSYVMYSGPDVGTTFSVKAVTSQAVPRVLPALTLTRGARHMALGPGGRELITLRGDLQHKDLWLMNLETGAERQLTHVPSDFELRDFDVSPDGRDIVLERVQERSSVVLLDLPQR